MIRHIKDRGYDFEGTQMAGMMLQKPVTKFFQLLRKSVKGGIG